MQEHLLIQQLRNQLQDYNTTFERMISTATQTEEVFRTTVNAAQQTLDEAQARATTERDAALQAASATYQQAFNIEVATLQGEQKALSDVKSTVQQQLTSARTSLKKRNWSDDTLLSLEKTAYIDHLNKEIVFDIQKTSQDAQMFGDLIAIYGNKTKITIADKLIGCIKTSLILIVPMFILLQMLLLSIFNVIFGREADGVSINGEWSFPITFSIIFGTMLYYSYFLFFPNDERIEKEEIKRTYQSLICITAQIEQRYEPEMARIKAVYDQNTAILAGTRDRAIAAAHATFTAAMTAAQTTYQKQKKKCDADNLRQLEALSRQSTTYDEQWKATTTTLIEQLETHHPAWSSSAWQAWKPATTPTTILRAGTLRWRTNSTHATPQAFHQHPLPFVVSFPGDHALLFKVTTSTKAPASAAIQSLMLRLVATNPPGKLRFTFIDP